MTTVAVSLAAFVAGALLGAYGAVALLTRMFYKELGEDWLRDMVRRLEASRRNR